MIGFENRHINPMLIGADGQTFDSGDFIYELKWDGESYLVYLDPAHVTELCNKRNLKMLPKVPELAGIHKQVKKRCILDGELMIMKNGRHDFCEIQKRSLTTNSFKIQLAAKQHPANFETFEILYYDGKDLTMLPLMERKHYLDQAIRTEIASLAISCYVPDKGCPLYALAKQQNPEGIVANLYKANNMISLGLSQYDQNEMIYKGHVTLGVGGSDFETIKTMKSAQIPPFPVPPQ